MGEQERQLKKLEEFKTHLLKNIRDASPLILKTVNEKNKEELQDLLSQLFVDNLEILNKIVITRGGKGERFTREALDAIKTNLLNLMK